MPLCAKSIGSKFIENRSLFKRIMGILNHIPENLRQTKGTLKKRKFKENLRL